MADDDKKPGSLGDTLTHSPLPYVVRMRVTIGGDDAVPESREWRGLAYSLLEAMVQAQTSVTGAVFSGDDTRIKIESIMPDPVEYYRLVASLAASQPVVRSDEKDRGHR